MIEKLPLLLFLLIASFLISFVVIPEIIKVVLGKKIVDSPGGRKIHATCTPSMGGVAIFFSFLLLSFFFVDTSKIMGLNFFYGAIGILFFTGLRDDFSPISSRKKLIVQIVAASIVAGMTNIRLESLYSLNFSLIEVFPEWFSFFLTVFVIVAFINAFNMIDGIDGLAGSVSGLMLFVLTLWFGFNQYWEYAALCIIMLGAIIGFLYYNWAPAKIFMGDTGSLIIGFFCATMSIVFLKLNEGVVIYPIKNSISFIIVLFIYPVFDTFRVVFIRTSKKISPFSPDKRHIHFSLLRLGLRHKQVSGLIFIMSFCLVGFHYFFSLLDINELLIILFIIIGSFLFHSILSKRLLKFTKNKKSIDLKKLSIRDVKVILKKK